MPANLENSAVATGLEKVSFHSSPKEGAIPKNVYETPTCDGGIEEMGGVGGVLFKLVPQL